MDCLRGACFCRSSPHFSRCMGLQDFRHRSVVITTAAFRRRFPNQRIGLCPILSQTVHFVKRMTHIISFFKTGPQPEMTCGAVAPIFQNGRREFSMSHISANIIDRKLILAIYIDVSRVKESKL